MKLAVFDDYRIGIVEGESVYDITAVAPEGLRALRIHMNWLIGNWAKALPAALQLRDAAKAKHLSSVKLHAPNPYPSHFFAARDNGFVLKAPGTLAGPAGGLRLPQGPARRFQLALQLAVIIGRRARNVPRSQAMDHVFGYACLVDLTDAPETPALLGPYLVTADEVGDPHALDKRLWVNGKLRQEAGTRDMAVGIAERIERISCVLPLNPGDVVATGAAEAIGPVNPGDRVKVAISQVGEMTLAVTSLTGNA